MQVLKKILRRLRGKRFFYEHPFQTLKYRGALAASAIRAFYIVTPALYVMNYQYYDKFYQPIVDQLWPIEWLNALGAFQHPQILVGALISFSLAPIVLPWSRLARLLALITALVFVAMANSQVDIGHWAHIWVLSSFWLFVLCPKRGLTQRRLNYVNLMSLAVVQAQWCAVYFCSGAQKLKALLACIGDQECAPITSSLSYLMANEFLATARVPVWAPFLVDRPLINILGLIGVLTFQLTAIVLLARPTMTFYIGILAASFHIGAYLCIGPNFLSTSAVIAILFILGSPPPALTLPLRFTRL